MEEGSNIQGAYTTEFSFKPHQNNNAQKRYKSKNKQESNSIDNTGRRNRNHFSLPKLNNRKKANVTMLEDFRGSEQTGMNQVNYMYGITFMPKIVFTA